MMTLCGTLHVDYRQCGQANCGFYSEPASVRRRPARVRRAAALDHHIAESCWPAAAHAISPSRLPERVLMPSESWGGAVVFRSITASRHPGEAEAVPCLGQGALRDSKAARLERQLAGTTHSRRWPDSWRWEIWQSLRRTAAGLHLELNVPTIRGPTSSSLEWILIWPAGTSGRRGR